MHNFNPLVEVFLNVFLERLVELWFCTRVIDNQDFVEQFVRCTIVNRVNGSKKNREVFIVKYNDDRRWRQSFEVINVFASERAWLNNI